MRYLKFFIPLLLVIAIDALFQAGIWEPLASPQSHAGMSISKKRALQAPAFKHIDFVTLGSSRPVYGIDHEALTKMTAQHGYVYANVSVPGMHFMSLGVITQWLGAHHPEIRGGIIALAVQDFLAPGNGTYELGIAYPFHTLREIPWMAQHDPFNWHDPATYGLYSALFEYHEDVQDLVAHPRHRFKLLRYFRALAPQTILQGNANETTNLCRAGISQLRDCVDVGKRDPSLAARLEPQCRMLQSASKSRYDIRPMLAGTKPLPEQLQLVRTLVRHQLESIAWPAPPIVVRMPMHDAWLRDTLPQGTHEWALSVLKPLVDAGKIRLLDYTDYFNSDAGTDCSAFFDFYHNNVSGRTRLMQQLLPAIERDLPPTKEASP